MKLRLRQKNLIPYGGEYNILDPLTGVRVTGTNFSMLVERVYAERKANGAVIGAGLEDEIEQWCCESYPAECEGWDGTTPRKRNLTLSDVLRGTRVMLAFKLSGSKLVDRAEAERRSAICSACKWNMPFAKPCTSGVCGELQEIVGSIINAHGTPNDIGLHACNICGCFLRAAVWVPTDIQCTGMDESMKAQFRSVEKCWKTCA